MDVHGRFSFRRNVIARPPVKGRNCPRTFLESSGLIFNLGRTLMPLSHFGRLTNVPPSGAERFRVDSGMVLYPTIHRLPCQAGTEGGNVREGLVRLRGR